MTVAVDDNRVEYIGDDSSSLFTVPFYFLADADLVVIRRVDATGVETAEAGYSVSGAGSESGGSITTTTVLASGETLIIYRDPAITQGVDLDENNATSENTREQALDRLTMIAQRINEQVDRSVQLSDGYPEGTFDPSLPSLLTANSSLVINPTNDGFDLGPSLANINTAVALASAVANLSSTAADNLSIVATVGSNQLTVAVKQIDGSTDPTSSSPSLVKNMRSETVTSGIPQTLSFTAATSLTVPDTATLGTVSATLARLYVYAIYDGTNKEIAISGSLQDETKLHNTTVLNTSSDSATVLYSTTARTNCAIKLIHVIESTQATAGTWATSPSRLIPPQPGTPDDMAVRYNDTDNRFEYYDRGTWTPKAPKLQAGGTYNIGINYSAGTFSITQADGSALAAGAPGWVGVPSTTSGQIVNLAITAPHTFIDDAGSSDIVGEEFGATTGVAWGVDRPFYLYLCNADDTDGNAKFFISPNPMLKQSPATSYIGYKGNPMSSPKDFGAFFLTSSDVTSTHAQKPCVRIGGFRMQMSASDDWTVQTLDESAGDGIRPDPLAGRLFVMPAGQKGAASSNYFYTATGTPPVMSSGVPRYYIDPVGGMMHYQFTPVGASSDGTAGAQLCLPLPLDVPETYNGSGTVDGMLPCGTAYIDGPISVIPLLANTYYDNTAGAGTRFQFYRNFTTILSADLFGSGAQSVAVQWNAPIIVQTS